MISIFYKKGSITTFRSKFLSHGTEKFCWGTIQCIRKIRLTKKFLDEMGISRFFVENFCLTVPKKFVRDPFCFKKILVWRIFMQRRGRGGIMVLPKHFCLTVPKNFVRCLFCFTKFLVSKKIMEKRGEGGSITIFCQKLFVSQCRKIS